MKVKLLYCILFLFYNSSPNLGAVSENLDPPVFLEPLKDCSVDEASNIVLQAVLAGSQPIKVTWLHNGESGQFTLQYLCLLRVRYLTLGSDTPVKSKQVSGHLLFYNTLNQQKQKELNLENLYLWNLLYSASAGSLSCDRNQLFETV